MRLTRVRPTNCPRYLEAALSAVRSFNEYPRRRPRVVARAYDRARGLGACRRGGHPDGLMGLASHIKVKEARHHGRDFSNDFSGDFDPSCLEIELLGGQTISFCDFVGRAVGFWSDSLEDHKTT